MRTRIYDLMGNTTLLFLYLTIYANARLIVYLQEMFVGTKCVFEHTAHVI